MNDMVLLIFKGVYILCGFLVSVVLINTVDMNSWWPWVHTGFILTLSLRSHVLYGVPAFLRVIHENNFVDSIILGNRGVQRNVEISSNLEVRPSLDIIKGWDHLAISGANCSSLQIASLAGWQLNCLYFWNMWIQLGFISGRCFHSAGL